MRTAASLSKWGGNVATRQMRAKRCEKTPLSVLWPGSSSVGSPLIKCGQNSANSLLQIGPAKVETSKLIAKVGFRGKIGTKIRIREVQVDPKEIGAEGRRVSGLDEIGLLSASSAGSLAGWAFG